MTFHVCRPDGGTIGEFPEDVFRDKIFSGEIASDDCYWRVGMLEWARVSDYRAKENVQDPVTVQRARTSVATHEARAPSSPKANLFQLNPKKQSPASIGALCAVAAMFAPLVYQGFFFLVSLPLLLAAFVLAIVSLIKLRILGGILLLMGLVIAGPASCEFMLNRDKWVHHPEQIAAESQANLDRMNREEEISKAIAENHVLVGMTKGEVLRSWGRPWQTSHVDGGELWDYGTAGALRFENNKVTSIQK